MTHKLWLIIFFQIEIDVSSNIGDEISKLALPAIDLWTGADFWKKVQSKPSLVFLDYNAEFAKNVEIRKISKVLNTGTNQSCWSNPFNHFQMISISQSWIAPVDKRR